MPTITEPTALPTLSPPATDAPAPRPGASRTPARRSTLAEVIAELAHSRYLLYQLTLRDIRIRYKQAVMGFAWAVFMPCLIVMAGCVVRFAMAQATGASLAASDIAALAIKGVAWAFVVGALGFATSSLTSNGPLVTKVYFPREVLPLSSVLAQAFDTLIGLTALLIALPFLGVRPALPALWAPVLLVLLVLFTTALSLFLSCANLFFRDVKYIVQVVLTFGIFFTPIFFEPAMLGPRGAELVMLNPLAPIVEGLRLSLVQGHDLLTPLVTTVHGRSVVAWQPWYLAYSAVVALGGFLAGAVVFHRAEFAFAEYV